MRPFFIILTVWWGHAAANLNGQVSVKPLPVRAVWVVRDALKTPQSIDTMLSLVREAHFTDVFLQVRGRGDAYYNSRIVPKAEGIAADFDPLTYLFSKTKNDSFRMHAWLNVFLIWSADKAPADDSHVLLSNPDWAAVSETGESMIAKGVQRIKKEGDEGIFFSPASEEFQRHMLDVTEELIVRYPFHGIHLDYIRYPRLQYDYSAGMRSRFILQYHTDPLQIVQNRGEKKAFPSEPRQAWLENTWNDFRRSMITATVSAIRALLIRIHPDVYLSAAVFAGMDESDNVIFQPWPEWVKDQTVDFVVMMNYATDNKVFMKRVQDAADRLGAETFRNHVVVGLSLYNQKPVSVSDKLQWLRKNAIESVSFFSYETLRTQPAYRKIITVR